MGEDPGRIRTEIEQTRDAYAADDRADRIRDEIDETRAQMGDTMEALGQKANVPQRVKGKLADGKDAVASTLSGAGSAVAGTADSLVSHVSSAVPDGQQVRSGAARVGVSKQNPLGLAVAGAAIGFVVGTLLPSTTVEDERLGETADQVKEKVREAGGEAVERGKQVAQQTLDTAKETARETAGEQSEELAASLQESAREMRSGTTS